MVAWKWGGFLFYRDWFSDNESRLSYASNRVLLPPNPNSRAEHHATLFFSTPLLGRARDA